MSVPHEVSSARFAAVVRSAMDAIILIDQHQRITVFNAAAEQIFRCPAEQALGQLIAKFIPDRFRAVHERHVREYGRTGATTRSMYHAGEVMGLRADGVEFPAEATISHGSVDGEIFYAVILRDISERRKCEQLNELLHKMEEEEAVRLYRHDLETATSMQQHFLAVAVPETDFATITYASLPYAEVAGDFVDFVRTPTGIAVVVGDACGKGLRAAVLASILRAMIHVQLCAGIPLGKIAANCNGFLCQHHLQDAYATGVIAHITAEGELEFINCGHVSPIVISAGRTTRLDETNVPVGLISDAVYQTGHLHLHADDRLVFLTDGITEAENQAGEFFGQDRAEQEVCPPCHDLVKAVRQFCDGAVFADDCTVVEFLYRGAAARQSNAKAQAV